MKTFFKAPDSVPCPSKLSTVPKSLRIKEPLSARPGLISPHTLVYCTYKMDPGFPILLPQSDLPASAPGVPACHSPTSRHTVELGPHPRPPHRPRSRGCGRLSRSLAPGASVSGGVRAVQAESERLPEAGPPAPPPAAIGLWPERVRKRREELGPSRASPGPDAGHPGRRRSLRSACAAGTGSPSRALLVRSPRSRHNGLQPERTGREKTTATTRTPEVPPQSDTPAQQSLALIGRCLLIEASRPALFWVSAL